MLSTQVNKQWSGKKLSRGGQLPEFYVLLIKPLLIASRTPFITKIYLTLIQCPPTYIWRVPNFPPNLHFQRWNIPPPWMVGKRGVVAFSSGEGTVDWVRIQRLVKGCPTATNTTVALQLHWNQFLASITLLLACWTFHIGCQLKNTFHYNYSALYLMLRLSKDTHRQWTDLCNYESLHFTLIYL